MSYRGDIRLGDTIDIKFTTVNTSGVPTVLAGTPVVSAYVGNDVVQLTAGVTLTVDFDAVVGLNNVRVVATGANGYLTASNYQLVITTGTVGGSSVVGYVVGSFSIEARSSVMPTVAARTLDISATGEAGIDWANIGSPTTANNLSATNIDVDQIVASVSGAVGSVTSRVTANTDQINGSATSANRLQKSTVAIAFCTVGAASTTTSIVTSSMDPAAAVIDQFKGKIVTFASDTTTANLRSQSSNITASTVLGVLTIVDLTTAPVSGDTFVIT